MTETFGPWGRVCAVLTCQEAAHPQICPFDQRYHRHGCIHYDNNIDQGTRVCQNTGLVFREGWGWVCDEHYQQIKAGWEARKLTWANA